jgi:hypothetical protein
VLCALYKIVLFIYLFTHTDSGQLTSVMTMSRSEDGDTDDDEDDRDADELLNQAFAAWNNADLAVKLTVLILGTALFLGQIFMLSQALQ